MDKSSFAYKCLRFNIRENIIRKTFQNSMALTSNPDRLDFSAPPHNYSSINEIKQITGAKKIYISSVDKWSIWQGIYSKLKSTYHSKYIFDFFQQIESVDYEAQQAREDNSEKSNHFLQSIHRDCKAEEAVHSLMHNPILRPEESIRRFIKHLSIRPTEMFSWVMAVLKYNIDGINIYVYIIYLYIIFIYVYYIYVYSLHMYNIITT